MNIKRTAAFILAALLVPQTVFASVFGTQEYSSGGVVMGINTGTTYFDSRFTDGELHQAEYYFEYTPNENVTPIVTNGDKIYGKRTLTEAEEYIRENGLIPLMGINADYFSFKTGIPMGHEIIDGEIVSKSQECQQAVGFRADGTAFMDWLQIRTALKYNGTEIEIGNINKWRQPSAVPAFLLTDEFGDTAKTSTSGYVMVLSKKSGSVSLREEAVFTVEQTYDADGDIDIPDGKYIITIDNSSGDESVREALKSIPQGAEVTLSNRDYYKPELWQDAEYAMSSVGGRILENGVIPDGLDKTREPRSAVGIKADGTLVLYLVDGRQSGYSSGATLPELAKRLSEIGCVDAINLDGGGSSAIGTRSDKGVFTVLNKPSDGSLRKCASYIFLRDNRKPTGIPALIKIQQEQNAVYIDGDTFSITYDSILDTNGFNMYLVDDMEYTIENEGAAASTVSADGVVTAAGSGTSTVYVKSGNASASLVFNVRKKSEFSDISGHWAQKDIEQMAEAGIVNGSEGEFLPENNVTRAEFAVMTAKALGLDISAAHTDFPDDDEIPAWARGSVAAAWKAGIISGKTDPSGRIYFAPSDMLTRAEAAVMLARAFGAKGTVSRAFTDSADIPEWASESINALAAANVITGYDDGSFRPASNVTRAESAVMINKLLSAEK